LSHPTPSNTLGRVAFVFVLTMGRPRLKLTFDVPEPRTLKERLVASADGSSWYTRPENSTITSDTTFLDNATKTLMLLPLPFGANWMTNFSGDYSRLAKSDYSLITASKWVEHHREATGDIFLESLGVNEVVTTTATYPQNQPIYISQFVYGITKSKVVLLECGWGSPGVGVSLRFSADGNVQIWKDTTFLKQYDFGNATSITGDTSGNVAGGKKAWTNEYMELCLIPGRARDLMILAGGVGSIVHTFADLDNDNTVQPITAAGSHFWWKVPSGKASVQCCPLHFETSGIAYGTQSQFLYPPATGTTFTTVPAYHEAGFGAQSVTFDLVDPHLTPFGQLFVPNGVRRDVIVRANLGGDGDSTPFIYGCDFYASRTATTTANSPFELMPYAASLSLQAPEGEAATLSFTARNGDKLQADGLAQPGFTGDRPVRLAIEVDTTDEDDNPVTLTIDLFRGTAAKPDIIRGGDDPATSETKTLLKWEARDRTAIFENHRFRSTLPYDGYSLVDAVTDLATMPGYAADDLYITADTTALPFAPPVKGQWKYLPERGESIQDWLQNKIHTDFAATWLTGWMPTKIPARATPIKYRYVWKRPDDLPQTPDIDLFWTRADALASGLTDGLALERVVTAVRELPEEAEANQVIVIGQDPGTLKFLYSQWDDAASQAPGTAPSSRPENWRGQTITYQLLDPSITTQDAADAARDIISDRIGTGRKLVEFDTAQLLVKDDGMPVWKGDLMRIYRPDMELYGWFRVLGLSFESEFEAEGFEKRRATYRTLFVEPDEE